jgi:hypothetical protein
MAALLLVNRPALTLPLGDIRLVRKRRIGYILCGRHLLHVSHLLLTKRWILGPKLAGESARPIMKETKSGDSRGNINTQLCRRSVYGDSRSFERRGMLDLLFSLACTQDRHTNRVGLGLGSH